MATAKQAKIIDTKTRLPQLTTRQVAKLCDTDHAHVVKVLKKYQINKTDLDNYKNNKADIWQGLSHRLLSNLTPDQIQKASALQLVTAAGIAESKFQEMTQGKTEAMPMVIINKISVGQVEATGKQGERIDVNNSQILCSTTTENTTTK